ncbi:hypothetical protein AGR4C_pa50034 [Agrobacterium tumefaciens str. Kerr 14]|uniref:Uncharacterized protein n=1 Tax=Agrobacterium tumefaciens str. Kerr 14 TaxID=1183424 RepID=A0A1S7SAI3_AGRTU|nr:hypothetical protein [Agrobacterium tumefaciens]CUX65515.1 hypothetical protein AGR4C_pa50034 [Agrobacterium tumefaciens str. Kerr 14]
MASLVNKLTIALSDGSRIVIVRHHDLPPSKIQTSDGEYRFDLYLEQPMAAQYFELSKGQTVVVQDDVAFCLSDDTTTSKALGLSRETTIENVCFKIAKSKNASAINANSLSRRVWRSIKALYPTQTVLNGVPRIISSEAKPTISSSRSILSDPILHDIISFSLSQGVVINVIRHYGVPTKRTLAKTGQGYNVHLYLETRLSAEHFDIPDQTLLMLQDFVAFQHDGNNSAFPTSPSWNMPAWERAHILEHACYGMSSDNGGSGYQVIWVTNMVWNAIKRLYPNMDVLERDPIFYDGGKQAPPVRRPGYSGGRALSAAEQKQAIATISNPTSHKPFAKHAPSNNTPRSLSLFPNPLVPGSTNRKTGADSGDSSIGAVSTEPTSFISFDDDEPSSCLPKLLAHCSQIVFSFWSGALYCFALFKARLPRSQEHEGRERPAASGGCIV